MNLHIVILAAGQGKRMKSSLPKVLQPLAGKPLLQHIITTSQTLNPQTIHVVYGHQGQQVRQALNACTGINWIEQAHQLGTGHAMLQALDYLPSEARVLILPGDVPLIKASSLQKLLAKTPEQGLGVLTAHVTNPEGLGRILRDEQGQMIAIVESKDATPEQLMINEINSAIMVTSVANLQRWLPCLKNTNQQAEYYMTDIIPFAIKDECSLVTVVANNEFEVQGINDKFQLNTLERYMQFQQARDLLLAGVTIMDPARLDIRGEVQIGADVTIDINVILEGKVTIGANCTIGPHTLLRNVCLGDNVHVKAHSVLEDAQIGDNCQIGPFARIRPGTKLEAAVHIGNFVEVKNTTLGEGSKANHLTYLGDATIGSQTNIGAGTITCNYDGVNKHRTTIGDKVFIGSATQLVAPVTIGNSATIGAGSTITKDAPPNTLTLSRTKQQSLSHWRRPTQQASKE